MRPFSQHVTAHRGGKTSKPSVLSPSSYAGNHHLQIDALGDCDWHIHIIDTMYKRDN